MHGNSNIKKKAHYIVHNSPPLEPILSLKNPSYSIFKSHILLSQRIGPQAICSLQLLQWKHSQVFKLSYACSMPCSLLPI